MKVTRKNLKGGYSHLCNQHWDADILVLIYAGVFSGICWHSDLQFEKSIYTIKVLVRLICNLKCYVVNDIIHWKMVYRCIPVKTLKRVEWTYMQIIIHDNKTMLICSYTHVDSIVFTQAHKISVFTSIRQIEMKVEKQNGAGGAWCKLSVAFIHFIDIIVMQYW